MKYYNPDQLLVRVASSPADIKRVVDSMREEMVGDTIGLDAEWNRVVNARGLQIGRSRILWTQIAYRNRDGNIRVLLLYVGELTSLPNSLQSLLCDSSIKFAGVRVSGDVKYIGDDFNIAAIKSVDQKKRDNVINLGMYARVRDVVSNANVSLRHLAEITLDVTIDKTLQTSIWSKDVTEAQKKYMATDAAASLEVLEALSKLKDLSRRLSEADAKVGALVDLVPLNGSPASMATRSATGTIVGFCDYVCPVGYTINGKRSITVGKRAYVVKIDKIHAPGLVLPRYRHGKSKNSVTLADLGEVQVLVPLGMLVDHIPSDDVDRNNNVSAATVSDEPRDRNNITSPASASAEEPRRSERGRVPRVRLPIDGYESEVEVVEEDEVNSEWEDMENQIDESMKGLTSRCIESLRAAIFESQQTEQGSIPLQCDGLDAPPKPELIEDKFSASLGDVFHAMDRSKVPMKHEAKKAYFVALREAFLVWNKDKMQELEAKMRESGMTDKEIRALKYHHAALFRACIERTVPPPSILYWRVRAVYALYGNMIDSKTEQPLFNAKAWKRANNVLNDILDGYYSDPPGLYFYTKKLGKNGEVMTNKYGLDIIECFRGTNRVEAYHKNLTVTFGRWQVGIEMSDCLLAERRHRHNHRCSELRRLGFHRIGHFNTWIIDQLQNLVRENHDIQLYPYWTNASDYKPTNETFDTIALHHKTLHQKLAERCMELGEKTLTREQRYMCNAMGTPLPILPFVTKEESLAYAQYVLELNGPINYNQAAVDWLKYVDGVNIMPKLPSHMRTHDEAWSRNRRVKDCVRNARGGKEKLDELNAIISPQFEGAAPLREAELPQAMPQPKVQALDNVPYQLVGGVLIGNDPVPTKRKRLNRCRVCEVLGCAGATNRSYCPLRKEQGAVPTEKIYTRQCAVCKMYGPRGLNCGVGVKNRALCRNFDQHTGMAKHQR